MSQSAIADALWRHGLYLPQGRFDLVGKLNFEAPCRLMACSVDGVKIGAYSYVAAGSRLEQVDIGRYCSIADGVRIGLGGHPLGWTSSNPFSYFPLVPGMHEGAAPFSFDWRAKPTEIGHDVWICAQAMIPGGVTIGTGAVVAAGSIVTKDVPAYAVMAGNPAQVVKMRFPDELAADLLSSQWWQYDWPAIFRGPEKPLWHDPRALLEWLAAQTGELPLLSGLNKRLWLEGKELKIDTGNEPSSVLPG